MNKIEKFQVNNLMRKSISAFDMSRISLALFAIPMFLGCSSKQSAGHPIQNETVAPELIADSSRGRIDCGNLVAASALRDFANLIRSIAKSDAGAPLADKRLYAENIIFIQEERSTPLTREELGSYLGTLPSQKDWLTIASEIERGAATSGGWRGCFVSNGKAAFVADSSGNIGLSAFDFDRQWDSR
jgi:hypothetical protein